MDMVYDPNTGTYVPQQPTQPPAQPVYQQPVQQPVYQQPAAQQPVYTAPAPGMGTAVDIFQRQSASTALTFVTPEDSQSSMDDLGGAALPSIKMNEMGWLVKVVDGVEMLPQQYLDVVILGIGPKGGDVYRTYYEGQYNNQQQQSNPPVCYSYEGTSPAANAPKRQAAACATCPMNAANSGPNGSKACKYRKYLVVMDVNEPDRLYRVSLSATPIFSKEVQGGFFPLTPYRTYLASNKTDWEKVVTRLSCPFGKAGGYRFQAVNFITEQLYNITKDLKMKLDLTAYLTLNNEQLTVAVNGVPVAQIPVQQVPHIPTAQPAPAQIPEQVVQYAQQQAQPAAAPTMTQPMNPAPAAPVTPAAPATPPPAPVQTLKERFGADQSLPQNVRDWINHPQITEQQVHDYVAQHYPHLLAPTPAPAQPVPTTPAAPTQPVAQTQTVQSAPQVVQQAVAPAAVPTPTAAPAPVAEQHVASVQPTQPAAQPGATGVSQPAPTTQPMTTAAQAVAGTPTAVVDQVLGSLGIDTGDALDLL